MIMHYEMFTLSFFPSLGFRCPSKCSIPYPAPVAHPSCRLATDLNAAALPPNRLGRSTSAPPQKVRPSQGDRRPPTFPPSLLSQPPRLPLQPPLPTNPGECDFDRLPQTPPTQRRRRQRTVPVKRKRIRLV